MSQHEKRVQGDDREGSVEPRLLLLAAGSANHAASESAALERWTALLGSWPTQPGTGFGRVPLTNDEAPPHEPNADAAVAFDAVVLDWCAEGSDDPAPVVRARERAALLPLIVIVPQAGHERAAIARRLGARATLGAQQDNAVQRADRLRAEIERERMLGEVRAARTQRRRDATRDALTGLLDRAALLEQLDRMLAAGERAPGTAALLLFDLDEFAGVDERLGRPASDEVLRALGQRLRNATRRGDLSARVGGDEFAVVLAAPRDAIAPARAAAHFLGTLAAPLRVHGCELQPAASVGIAVAPRDGSNADALLGAARHALVRAKQSARGGHCHADPALDSVVGRVFRRENELRAAIAAGDAPLRCEVQVDVAGGHVAALRTELAWSDAGGASQGAVTLPATPLFDHPTSLAADRLAWTVRASISLARELAAAGGAARSLRSLLLDARAEGDVGAALAAIADAAMADAGVPSPVAATSAVEQVPAPAGRVGLDVEIVLTPSGGAWFADPTLVDRMHRLRECGIGIALHVDGLSAASMAQLRVLPLTALVIDGSRSLAAPHDEAERSLLEAMIRVARSRGLRVVADGVEGNEQRDLLVALGCPEMRGSLFAKPMSARECAALLRDGAPDALAPWEPALDGAF